MKPVDVFGPKEKAEYRRLLDEIGQDYCPEGRYCIFKEFLINAHPSRRLLVQLKSVDRMKLIWSKDAGNDIGWDVALQKWVDSGNAVKFAESYTDTKPEKEIFKEIISKPTKPSQ
jgi:hypothetical protein